MMKLETHRSLHQLPIVAALAMMAAGCPSTIEPKPDAALPIAAEPAPPAAPAGASPASAGDAEFALREGEHAKLARLVGEWEMSGTLELGEKRHRVNGEYTCVVARGGVALRCETAAEVEGVGQMYESALIGVDPHTNQLHWYNVTTMGETHDHVGTWSNGDGSSVDGSSVDRIEWTFEGEMRDLPMTETIAMRFVDAATLSFRSETKLAGKRASLLAGTLTR